VGSASGRLILLPDSAGLHSLRNAVSASATSPSYVVVGRHPWNRRVFEERIQVLPGRWHYVDDPEALTPERLQALTPRYVFFLHWSARVPSAVLDRFECVCFHMTDLPYGRGGSPLQNLIARGHRETQVTALRMTEAFDAGPVYLKRPLSLEGNDEEIFIRSSRVAADMIEEMLRGEPEPVPQQGEPVVFRRRTPEQSRIAGVMSLDELYDHIRMLDARGYPQAFLDLDGFRYTFRRAALYDGRIVADVVITPLPPLPDDDSRDRRAP
jgi:methionyl-tRNA formyltransferase